MQISVDRLAETTGAKGIVVELVDGDALVFRACNQPLRQYVGRRYPRKGSLSGLCLEQNAILICDETENDGRTNQEACLSVGVHSLLCAPLIGSDGEVGVLKLMARQPSAFTPKDAEAVSLTARALGAALCRQLAYAKQAASVRALEAEILARQRLEATEAAHKTRLSNLIKHAHQAIITTDNSGHIRSWNPFAETMFGWSTAEALGRDVFELLLPLEDRALRRENMKRFRESGRAKNGKRTEWTALRRHGEAFPIEIAINGFEGPDGWEFTGMMHDISERRAKIELFEASFQHAAIGMALVGLEGAFLKVNPTLQEMLGYSEAELLGMTFQSITHPEDLQDDLGRIEALLAGTAPNYRMDKRYLRSDGSVVWARLAVALVLNPDGSPHHFISQIEDLSARRLAEAALADSEHRYRVIAENTSDMIVTADLKGFVTFISPICKAIMGCEPEFMMGRRPLEFTHPDDVSEVQRVFRNTAGGAPGERVRWRSRHALEDRWVWLESNPSLLSDPMTGDPTGFLDVVRDVTVQVAQEEALRAARTEAETATAIKSEFLANMSHEIRTPLTAVLGFSSLLAERDDLDEAARLQVQRIVTASTALLSIVNDVLDFSKLEAGQFEITPRPVSPAEASRDALTMFAPQAEAKGLELRCRLDENLPTYVAIDPDRYRQILLNLVGNALKFTDSGSITLRVAYDHQDEKLLVRVEDTGPGLTQAQQLKLFQRFSQVDASATRKHGGTGLGLAICKGLSEAMGGGITVSSAIGQGSCFAFHIAAPKAEAPQANEGLSDDASIVGVRLLVIDDNPVNREVARAVLEAAGAQVSDAGDGRTGAALAMKDAFDVILLDLNMPGLSGVETLALLRAQPGPNQSIPIAAFTADADLNRLGQGHTFDEVVRKPIAVTELIDAVYRLTHKS